MGKGEIKAHVSRLRPRHGTISTKPAPDGFRTQVTAIAPSTDYGDAIELAVSDDGARHDESAPASSDSEVSPSSSTNHTDDSDSDDDFNRLI